MRWFSKKQAMVYAGVSMPTLDKWIKNGLPASKVGGRVLIDRRNLDKFISSGGRPKNG